MKTWDVIVVGAGHNGLVAAGYLARAGLEVLVLEKNDWVGGAAVSRSLHPGILYSNCSYVCSLLRPEIMRDLELPRHGLQVIPYEGGAVFTRDGDALATYRQHDAHRREIQRFSLRDAEAYDEFGLMLHQMARAIKPMLGMAPPDPTSLSIGELRAMAGLGRYFREMKREHFYRLTKLLTMSSADFLDEWFETEALKATKSASGVIGTMLGPRSPGTAYVLLHHYMGELDGVFRAWGFAKGGNGSVSAAIAGAARAAGAEIRTSAPVSQVLLKGHRAIGVVLQGGEEIRAKTVVSGADPRRTFLDLVGEKHLPAEFVDSIRRFRFRGSSAKVNLALGELPDFTCLPGRTCAAPFRSARAWNISSAPTTTRSTARSRAGRTWTSSFPRCSTPKWRRRGST
jgi:phytoene dehydrogenase-like protein